LAPRARRSPGISGIPQQEAPMSDPFGYRYGYRPQRPKLFDGQLKLDPQIVAMMDEIERELASMKLLHEMQNPDWLLLPPLFRFQLTQPPPLMQQAPGATPLPQVPVLPSPVPVPYPSAPQAGGPKPGEISDVLRAVYKLPAVQKLVGEARDEGARQLRVLRNEWRGAPASQRVIMVSMAVIVSAGFIAPIIANKPTRDTAFGLIKGKDIPVPGVDGLSFKILDHGGGITAPLFVPGLSGSAELDFPNSSAATYKASILFDVSEFWKKRGKK
jgi:hypothetical protein